MNLHMAQHIPFFFFQRNSDYVNSSVQNGDRQYSAIQMFGISKILIFFKKFVHQGWIYLHKTCEILLQFKITFSILIYSLKM